MTQSIEYNGGQLVLDPQNGEDILVNIADTVSGGTITSNPLTPSGGALSVNGHGSSNIGVDTGSVSYRYIAVYDLGENSYIMARNAPLIIEGKSYEKPTIVYADNLSVLNNIHEVQATLLNTVLVANGDNAPDIVTIQDKGGNNIWASQGITNVVLARPNYPTQLPTPDSNVFAGKENGTFVVSKNLVSQDTTLHLSLILDVINTTNPSVSPSYSVQTPLTPENDTTTEAETYIYQKSGTLDFKGSNSSVVLNSAGNQTQADLVLYNGNTVWAGDGTTNATLMEGENLIFNSGDGSIYIEGYTPQVSGNSSTAIRQINRLELTGNENGTGVIHYTQGHEAVSIYNQYGLVDASLGEGTSTISLGSLNAGYTIEIGEGNVILNDYTKIAGIPQNLSFEYADQSITLIEYYEGNTIYHLSTNNSVTFTNTDLRNDIPFTNAPPLTQGFAT